MQSYVRSENMVKGLFLAADVHWALVCLIGIAVVFAGLAIIIGLVELMNLVTTNAEGKKTVKTEQTQSAPAPVSNAGGVIENRDEIVAAVCAAVAEENGTDISAIRVVSFKKI